MAEWQKMTVCRDEESAAVRKSKRELRDCGEVQEGSTRR